MDLRQRLSGVTAVPVTPFARGGGSIDEPALEALLSRLDGSGVHAITVLGATGEVFQLSAPERRAVIRVAAGVRTNTALLAGLAGPLTEMLELGAYAAEQGFDAVMIHEPADPGGSREGLLGLYQAVADESALPVVAYVHTARLDESGLRELVAHPNVAAVKYAVADLERTAALFAGDLAEQSLWVCGLAETWVPAFAALGMRGFTSGLANVEPALALGLLSAVQSGEALDVLFNLVAPFEELRNHAQGRYNVAAIKAALAGEMEPDVRPPSARLDTPAQTELARILAAWSAYLVGAGA